MKHLIRAALLVVVLAVPALAQRAPTGDRPQVARRSPVAFLLERRAELGLTGDQVARLEAVAARLEESSRPLAEQLRQARPSRGQRPRDLTPEQRQALRDSLEQYRPLIQQLRDNRREAMHQAQAVLTQEQRQKARELMRAQRAELRRENPRGSRRGPRHPGAPPRGR